MYILILLLIIVIVSIYYLNSEEKFQLLSDEKSENRFYKSKFNLKDYIDVIALVDSQTIYTSESSN